MAAEEVRPCLRCDGLAPAAAAYCPACGALLGNPRPGGAATLPPPSDSGGILLAEAIVVTAAAALCAGTAFAFLA